MNIDFDQLVRVFGRSGERVVLVLPGQEPVVLVPLKEYDALTAATLAGSSRNTPKLAAVQAEVKLQPLSAAAPAKPLEVVDPLQGGLPGDDQYFPEPLD